MQQTIGQRLAARREALSMTQDELAEKSGVSRPRISQIENDGVADPRRNTLAKLATALDIPVEQLCPAPVRHPLPAPTAGLTSGAATVAEAENVLLRELNAELKLQIAYLREELGKSGGSSDAADSVPTQLLPLMGRRRELVHVR